jgi:DNA-binding XRE family transcriptional regulator
VVVNPAEQFASAMRETWGERVKRRRDELALTQAEACALCEISQGTLAKIEAGRMWPSDIVKVKVAWGLGCKPGTLWNWGRA